MEPVLSSFIRILPACLSTPNRMTVRRLASLRQLMPAFIMLGFTAIGASFPDYPVGRVWLENGSFRPMDVVRIVGHRFRFMYTTSDTKVDLAIFDQQVRAFGKDLQSVLKRLIIGVVGAGGTGSSVAEQLIRLGAGHLLVADPQRLAASNVTRVYGSSVRDAGRPKVELIARLASSIGFGTQIETVDGAITFESVLKQFRKCDVIFGCTDDQWGRSLLNRLSIYYCIPVLDLGVRIDSKMASSILCRDVLRRCIREAPVCFAGRGSVQNTFDWSQCPLKRQSFYAERGMLQALLSLTRLSSHSQRRSLQMPSRSFCTD